MPTHTALMLALALTVALAASSAWGQAPPTARNLADFTNDDSSRPDGKDDANDDTTALRKALAAGPGLVHLGAGAYRCGDVSIPAGVTLAGAGAGTIVRSNGAKVIFSQQGLTGWALRDLVLDGEAPGDWHARQDAGQSGLAIARCWGYDVVGVTVRNCNGPGIQISYTDLGGSGHAAGGNLSRITVLGCWAGLRLDVRAEYVNVSELSCLRNVTGCIIHGGNAKLAASNLSENVDGILIEDKDNGSHGALSNCLVNHNERYALLARNAMNGMAVDGCAFFYGTIQLENCAGINITSGLVSCNLALTAPAANRLAGNYIIPLQWKHELSGGIIAEGNFTDKGPWEKNTR